MGKSPYYPLPSVLNNKFDSMPPAEGTVFDFVFDYKARGQWKHWSDAVKNTDVADGETFIPTNDTARYRNTDHLLCVKCKRQFITVFQFCPFISFLINTMSGKPNQSIQNLRVSVNQPIQNTQIQIKLISIQFMLANLYPFIFINLHI
jgi:hypothetical protein